MRNKFDNILLGLLWLLLSTLGTCFWFNTQFGFNILSSTHWHHLAYMQATRTQIKPLFYISMIVAVFCIVFGLYLLLRPRFRKITPPQATEKHTESPTTANIPDTNDTDPFALTRPKRLNNTNTTTQSSSVAIMTAPIPGTVTPETTPSFTPPRPSEQPDTEIQDIFRSAGYIIKNSPVIHGYKIPLVAIGNGETLWIGCKDMTTSTMQSILDSFQQVFSETLEDITITTIGFVVNPGDISNPAQPNILTFKNTDELRAYISENPNPPLEPEMAENFEAFSGYISTVIDYIGNL